MSNVPTNPTVEIQIDGEWIDITDDCRLNSASSGGGIHIKRGRSNEASSAEPSEVEFTLNNGVSKVDSTAGQTGVYSALNPSGPYYGKLGRNLPVRVGLDRIRDDFTRSEALNHDWGSTPDWVDREGNTRAGSKWKLYGSVGNFTTTTSSARLQAGSGLQMATLTGKHGDVSVWMRFRFSTRDSDIGIVLRSRTHQSDTQVDGSFENGVGDWQIFGGTSTLTSASDFWRFGTKSAKMTVAGSPSNVYMRPTAAHLYPVIPGRQYKIRAWVRLSVTGDVYLSADSYLEDLSYDTAYYSGPIAVNANEWFWVEYSFTVSASAAYILYGPGFAPSPANGTTMHVDRVLLIEEANNDYVIAYWRPGTPDVLRLAKVGPASNIAFPYELPSNLTVDTWYQMRAEIAGRRARARIWADTDPEPTIWQVSNYDDRTPPENETPHVGEVGIIVRSGTALATIGAIQFDHWQAHAEMSKLPVRFDLARVDRWVPVQARGLLRRLGQGRKALNSAVYLHLQKYSPSYAWLPLEEGAESGLISNAAAQGSAGTALALSFGTPDSTGERALPGVGGYAHMDSPTSFINVQIPAHSTGSAWTILCFFRLDQNPASDILLFRYSSTGTARTWLAYLQADGAMRIEARNQENVLLSSSTALLWGFTQHPVGCWIACTLLLKQSGGTVQWAWNYHRPGFGGGFFTINQTFSGTIGRPTQFAANASSVHVDAGGVQIAHVFHYAGDLPFVTYVFADAAAAYDGELSLDRFDRLLTDAGIRHSWFATDQGTPMGPQLPSKLLDLLDEIAAAEHGVVIEDRDELGVSIYLRRAMYLPMTTELDIDAGHLSSPLDPTPDDQGTRNDVTVKQKSTGLFARSVQETGPLNVNNPEDDPDGVGTYDEAPELNLGSSDDLAPAANWRRSLGTLPDPRYPSMRVDLTSEAYMNDPELSAEVLSIDMGRAVRIINPEVTPDPHTQLVQSYTKEIDQYDLEITMVTTPATVHSNIGVIGSNARVEHRGSVTAAAFTSGTNTALQVQRASSDYALWVRTADDAEVTGFDIMVSGVRLRVVSISGTSDPQTITVEQTPVNGVIKAIPVGSPVEIADAWRMAW